MKGKAFILVGHADWGKSLTLKEFTNGVRQYRWWKIKNKWIYIKRMSNDDDSKGLYNYIKKMKPDEHENIVLTLCPNFEVKNRKTEDILQQLNKNYEMFFFVLKYNYDASAQIKDSEVSELKKYGTVEILSKPEDKKVRAKQFKQFVESYI